MAAEKKCCVRGCEKTREQDNVVLHKFPNPDKDADRFRTWAFAVGGDIISLEDNYVYKYRRVCHEHFEHKYLTWSKMLTKNAVPTLHLKGFVIRRNPLIDITNREGPSVQDLNAASTSGATATPISTDDQGSQKNKDVAGQGSLPPKESKLKKNEKHHFNKQIETLQKEVKKLTSMKDK